MRLFLLTALLLGCVSAASAQLLPKQLTDAINGTPQTTAAQDPLGRGTPAGTVFGFLQAAQNGNLSTAAQYLQMTAAHRQAQGEELAGQLNEVLNRAFRGDVRQISNLPDGVPQEGTALDRQRIGVLSAGELEEDLVLVHVSDASGTKIWLFSADTLAKVPELYDQLEVRQVETRLPGPLKYPLLGMALWQWLAALIAVPIAAGLGWVAARLLRVPVRWWARRRKMAVPQFRSPYFNPSWLVLTTIFHAVMVNRLKMPLLARHYYQYVTTTIFIIGFSWLVWRILQEILRGVRDRAIYSGRTGTGSLLLLGERILKALVFLAAILAILTGLGFNMTTALAGVGIGGIAIAFAAQKTLENLFGGITVLGDEVIHVGDVCRFGDRTGTVEDISLRSTRIRTPERTALYIPNGSLATMNVENLSRRDKLLFNPKLAVRYETSADQLRYVLAQVRRMLYEHPKVETEGARIRFTTLDQTGLILEVFAYVVTRDSNEFLAIQEDLLLRIMDIVKASGTSLALPSQTVYVGQDKGLDADKTAAAVEEVESWREGKTLPFPDFAAKDISEVSNSLTYPPPESAVRKR
jgi:MscS family membrane protein